MVVVFAFSGFRSLIYHSTSLSMCMINFQTFIILILLIYAIYSLKIYNAYTLMFDFTIVLKVCFVLIGFACSNLSWTDRLMSFQKKIPHFIHVFPLYVFMAGFLDVKILYFFAIIMCRFSVSFEVFTHF